jgi:hypothetical protein
VLSGQDYKQIIIFYCFFLDRIYRIDWIFSFGRSQEESGQTPIACGEDENTYGFSGIKWSL